MSLLTSKIILKLSNIISRYLGIPISLFFVIIVFNLRYLFLGWNNANDFLSTLSKPYLIPVLRLFGAKIGYNCDIESGIRFHNCVNYKNLIVGDNCHIGKDCFFDLRGKVIIKNNVVISMRCVFVTHIDMAKSELTKLYPPQKDDILINDNVYIGEGVTILMGVDVGGSTIIGAKSLVMNNIEANSVVAGIPAKYIKNNFNQ